MKTTVRSIKCGDGSGHRDKSTYCKGLHSQSQGGLGAHQMAVEAKMSFFVHTQPGFKDT